MTEEQLAEIEQRWGKMMGSDNQYMRNISSNLFLDVRDLLAEVRRLNRMVDRAIDKLAEFGCVVDTDPCPANYVEVGCAECVRKYLESEVADK